MSSRRLSRLGVACEVRHPAGGDPEVQEFIVTMRRSWEDARTETQANALLTVLRVRGIPVPAAARRRILAEKDLQRLERWHEKAIVAASIKEAIGDRRSI